MDRQISRLERELRSTEDDIVRKKSQVQDMKAEVELRRREKRDHERNLALTEDAIEQNQRDLFAIQTKSPNTSGFI